MNKMKFIKSVSFNLKNEEDILINKHIARRNFSGYVKKLILQDITSKKEPQRKQETQTLKQQQIPKISKSRSVHPKTTVPSPKLNLPKL
jgi:hypothetical protein